MSDEARRVLLTGTYAILAIVYKLDVASSTQQAPHPQPQPQPQPSRATPFLAISALVAALDIHTEVAELPDTTLHWGLLQLTSQLLHVRQHPCFCSLHQQSREAAEAVLLDIYDHRHVLARQAFRRHLYTTRAAALSAETSGLTRSLVRSREELAGGGHAGEDNGQRGGVKRRREDDGEGG